MPLYNMLIDWLAADPASHGIIMIGAAIMALAVMLWLLAPPGEEGGNWIAWVFGIGAVLAIGAYFVSDYRYYYYY